MKLLVTFLSLGCFSGIFAQNSDISSLLSQGQSLMSRINDAMASGSSSPGNQLLLNTLSGQASALQQTMDTLEMDAPAGVPSEAAQGLTNQMTESFRMQMERIEEEMQRLENGADSSDTTEADIDNLINDGEKLIIEAEEAIQKAESSDDLEEQMAGYQLYSHISGLRMTMQALEMDMPQAIPEQFAQRLRAQMKSQYRMQSDRIEDELEKIQ